MLKVQAIQTLVEAVRTANAANPDLLLIEAMLELHLTNGLSTTGAGYKLSDVSLSSFGGNVKLKAALTNSSHAASIKVLKLVQSPRLIGFSLTAHPSTYIQGGKVALDITKLIPAPSAEVRALLPTVIWTDSTSGSASSSADFLSPLNSSDSSLGSPNPASPPPLLPAGCCPNPMESMLNLLPSGVTSAIEEVFAKGKEASSE